MTGATLDYVMRDIMEELPEGINLDLETSLRNFINFKNQSLSYKEKLMKQGDDKLETIKNYSEHLYHTRSAMKYAKYIKEKFSGEEKRLGEIMENEMGDLTGDMIESEKAVGLV